MESHTENLPTAGQIERLPLRAIVAYALGAARRASSELLGIVPQEVVEEALALTAAVATKPRIDEISVSDIAFAAARLMEAAISLGEPQSNSDVRKHVAVAHIENATTAASSAISAILRPSEARDLAQYAARAAVRAVGIAELLDDASVTSAIRDYEILLETFGEEESVVLGDPIDLSILDEKRP